MHSQTNRRAFLKNSAAVAAAVGCPVIVPASALGRDGAVAANERVNIGAISCGNRSGVTGEYEKYPKSEVVAICDPITKRRQRKRKVHPNAKDYGDFRDVLARSDIDAVHIATGDYWHVPISLAAARAGKDMYTEKPLGLSIEQDLAAREIVQKHHRIFQYGTQNRSMAQLRMGLELVLNGHIGDVKELYVWAPEGHSGGSPTPVLPVPDGFDYDMWLGPAPAAPFCKDRCLVQGPRNAIFHVYDYAIGFIAGWGAHPMDQLQWWADQESLGIPVEYRGTGSIPTEGLFNTITHWDVECTYSNGLKMRFLDNTTRQTATGIPHNAEIKFGHGTLLNGTKGWVAVTRGGWKVFPDELYHAAKEPGTRRLTVSTNHQQHFVDCVLEQKEPISNLTSAVQSDLICHLSDISIRTGRTIRWDAAKETIVGDDAAAKRMHREMRSPWTL